MSKRKGLSADEAVDALTQWVYEGNPLDPDDEDFDENDVDLEDLVDSDDDRDHRDDDIESDDDVPVDDDYEGSSGPSNI